ncbi:carbohydrate-binding protein [Halohasta litorea]|uniref:Carbohydrate-binding protein n=1 Tax=Halohasta litorea TaxID=869891 RepID=A0ABD6D6V3_9EURY|nr:carbohydrate-binding protein [Halohasta litorea]
MPTTNEFNRRSYLKLAGLSVGGAVTGAQTGVVSAATDVEPSGYGLGGYGLGAYGTPSVDGSIAVSTGSATEIGQTSARLGGTVTDLGGADSVGVVFEWGAVSSDQQRTTSRQQVSEPGDVTATIDELTPGTTYVFRLVATDTNGRNDTGTERQFTTRTATAGLGDESTLLPRDGTIVNAPYESEHAGYTGDGFVNFRESDSYVQWDVTTETSAEFDLTIRYALGADDRTGLLTGGATRREITVESTGGWTNWETTTERVSLPEGGSTIRIEAIGEDFGNVDSVALSRVSTDSPTDETPDDTPDSPTSKTLLPRDGEIGNALYQSEHAGYTGDGFVNFRASDSYVQWDVESATTTDYDLTLRYALGADDRTGRLTAGGSQQAVTVPSTDGWTNWETTTQRVTLPEGSSTLRIEATGEDFGNVDAVTLTPREETADEGWTSMRLLPQDADLGNALYQSEHAGYTGDGFVNFRESDSYVQWDVDTDAASEFDLTIRYALGAADRTGLLTAGGAQREITVESTGAWTTWETTTERISLPEGSSTLRIEAIGEDFGNIDALELERVQ